MRCISTSEFKDCFKKRYKYSMEYYCLEISKKVAIAFFFKAASHFAPLMDIYL